MGQEQTIYRVVFTQEDKIYEIYVRSVSEESLMGFIEVEEFVLTDSLSSTAQDSSDALLRAEFDKVKRSYIPIHLLLRIDEMKAKEMSKIETSLEDKGNIHHFPAKKKET